MKKEKEIYELIVAYLREVISEEEKMELQEWMDKHESHKRLFGRSVPRLLRFCWR